VILAGGIGKRLFPLTHVVSKHLLPVYDKPMIYYPIATLHSLGVRDIFLVINKESYEPTKELLDDGSGFGIKLTYAIQEYENKKQTGIAKALALADRFVGNEPVLVLLGDNIFMLTKADTRNIGKIISEYDSGKRSTAAIFLNRCEHPERFAVPAFDPDGKIIELEEKPAVPKSEFGQTGLYSYPSGVFDVLPQLSPSERSGEYEITDVNNWYLRNGRLDYCVVKGWWEDAGTFEGLFRAQKMRRSKAMTSKDQK
jgi:glucose-1-phosphate thymidylyltransferase